MLTELVWDGWCSVAVEKLHAEHEGSEWSGKDSSIQI